MALQALPPRVGGFADTIRYPPIKGAIMEAQMHYLDITDVMWQARVFWSMRWDWPLDAYITQSGYIHFLGE